MLRPDKESELFWKDKVDWMPISIEWKIHICCKTPR